MGSNSRIGHARLADGDVWKTGGQFAGQDRRIADPLLAEAGRREIILAEREMPGLMALRRAEGVPRPLVGARISGFLHMTVQTAVLVETLVELGAQVRWAGSDPLSTQDHAAAALAAGPPGRPGIPVFAWKGQTQDELWQSARAALAWPDGRGPNLLLDDGAGLNRLIHSGVSRDKYGALPDIGLPEEPAFERALSAPAGHWAAVADGVRGSSEETTTGARYLRHLAERSELLYPAISVNDSVTKSKFDNRYGSRHSVVDALNRATDVLIGGKLAVVCGYGDVGKGCAEALRGQGARVVVTEIDPICALQAVMSGFPVVTLDEVIAEADIVITTTGVPHVVTADHMAAMKHNAIVGNMAHDDTEIDVTGLAKRSDAIRRPVKPQVDEWVFADGHSVVLLSAGRMINLGNATGHPSFVMSASFTNQVLAQIELYTRGSDLPVGLHALSTELDERVARYHLGALDAHLTTLTDLQALALGVGVNGPFKPRDYRY
ncbi:adenosylhomocysteinase [Streptomyces sp. NPDC002018]|uniref:adenosylhomocysteinase n=1 Tax=Streptomyces sp. NPDC002018 TaxID=3364629 RepID=UPI003698B666